MIFTWFTGWSRNVGVELGLSGLLVIDEDQPAHSQSTQQTTAGRYSATPRGPLGAYGINVRSGNAYVVGPGSVHATGAVYTVEAALPVAPLPDWVVEAIRAKPRQEPNNGHKVPTAEEVLNSDPGGYERFPRGHQGLPPAQHTRGVCVLPAGQGARILAEARLLIREAWTHLRAATDGPSPVHRGRSHRQAGRRI
jgi:hypothetical protein